MTISDNWRLHSDPPGGQRGLWTKHVLAITNLGNVATVNYFHGTDGTGTWQRLAHFAEGENVAIWCEKPSESEIRNALSRAGVSPLASRVLTARDWAKRIAPFSREDAREMQRTLEAVSDALRRALVLEAARAQLRAASLLQPSMHGVPPTPTDDVRQWTLLQGDRYGRSAIELLEILATPGAIYARDVLQATCDGLKSAWLALEREHPEEALCLLYAEVMLRDLARRSPSQATAAGLPA